MPAFTLLKLPEKYPLKDESPFSGKTIYRRTPYIMQADLTLASGAGVTSFPDGAFGHNEAMPFEVLRMVPFIDPLASSGSPLSDSGIYIDFSSLLRFVQVNIQLKGASRYMTKVKSRLSAIVEKGSLVFDFQQPLYIERSEGFSIDVTHDVPSALAAGGIRVELGFIGNMLEIR